ncbi:MAG: acyl carrier protein [Ruminiclostridium sp.]|nr:acyl carrier protein [Ruminiclostridium sp.]
MTMTEKEKLAMLEDVLDAEEGSLSPDMSLDEVDEYDSMTKLSIVVMMEDEFDKKITADDVRAFRTVGDILALMEK